MKVLIVFESMFGNTAALAGDVMAGLAEGGADVVLADVSSEPGPELLGCDLLVLAAPTHALTPSRPEPRAQAVNEGADTAHAATGLGEWLTTLHSNLPPTATPASIAVFDTRVSMARHLPGSAARVATRAVRKSGFTVSDRVSFFVDDTTGPISQGEHERAREWGRALGVLVRPGAPSHGRG